MNRDTHLPLDPTERELAEALARLPALEPPPHLDARVLTTARAALRADQTGRHRRLRWVSAGFGSAAVAVLAAGIAWQSGLLEAIRSHDAALQAPPPPSAGAGAETTPSTTDKRAPPARAVPPLSSDAERQQQAHQMQESARATAAQAASANAARADDAQQLKTAPQAEKQEEQAPAPQAFPAPPPKTVTSPPAPVAAPLPAPAPIESAKEVETIHGSPPPIPMEEVTPMSVPALPPAPAAPPAPVASEAMPISGAQDRLQQRTPLPDWQNDAELAPDAWLERIGDRLRQGDRAGAAASLRGFVAKHPTTPVPAALAGLLDE